MEGGGLDLPQIHSPEQPHEPGRLHQVCNLPNQSCWGGVSLHIFIRNETTWSDTLKLCLTLQWRLFSKDIFIFNPWLQRWESSKVIRSYLQNIIQMDKKFFFRYLQARWGEFGTSVGLQASLSRWGPLLKFLHPSDTANWGSLSKVVQKTVNKSEETSKPWSKLEKKPLKCFILCTCSAFVKSWRGLNDLDANCCRKVYVVKTVENVFGTISAEKCHLLDKVRGNLIPICPHFSWARLLKDSSIVRLYNT